MCSLENKKIIPRKIRIDAKRTSYRGSHLSKTTEKTTTCNMERTGIREMLIALDRKQRQNLLNTYIQ